MRSFALAALLPILLVAAPAGAATKAQKMETCKVGADADNLEGKARDAFMKKCLGAGNYEPAARREAMKQGKKPAKKKSAAKKPMAAPAAPAAPEPTYR
jgi:psiF repeat